MKHNKKRIAKMVDELVTYMFSIGATDISINISDEVDSYRIRLESNYLNKYRKNLDKLQKYLNYDKQEEMEEYYWELAGDSDVDTELTLIGMMTDEAEIDYNDDRIKITLRRNKKG
ncbi:MAG: hypothetical protein HPY66_2791 [Firmicutes bacterium]|nr:hypothetical protein [Bacillota bacterium]MDI6705932.1 hypothetical protein [Bacillota bacterium]